MEACAHTHIVAKGYAVGSADLQLVVAAVAVVECGQPDTSESDGYRSAKSGISHPFCGKLLSYGERQMG